MNAPFAPPRIADRIHAPNCHCPRCRHAIRLRRDPRERRVRIIMFTAAALIGGTLGHLFTPQAVATAVITAL